MPEFTGFSAAFARIGAANNKAAFNERFRLLQNAFIRDLNEKTAEARTIDAPTKHRVERLEHEVEKLEKAKEPLKKYIFDTRTNNLRLKKAQDLLNKAYAFNADPFTYDGRLTFKSVTADDTTTPGTDESEDASFTAPEGVFDGLPAGTRLVIGGLTRVFTGAPDPDTKNIGDFQITSVSADGRTAYVTKTNGDPAEIVTDTEPTNARVGEGNQSKRITAEEVEVFNKNRDAAVAQLKKMTQLRHKDYTDGNTVTHIKSILDELESITVSEGFVSEKGDATAQANHAAQQAAVKFRRDLENFQSQTFAIMKGAQNYQGRAALRIRIANRQIDQMTELDQARQAVDIQKLRQRHATLLDGISRSYDAQSGLYDALAKSFEPLRPEAGSVLNLFS